MPKLRTDDQVRRLRALWLGPPGCRWPFDATYVEWMLGAVLTVGIGFVLWGLTTVTLGFPYNYLVTIPGAPSIGCLLAWVIRPHIEPNKPLGYWKAGIKTELRGMRAAEPLTVKVVVPRITRPSDCDFGNGTDVRFTLRLARNTRLVLNNVAAAFVAAFRRCRIALRLAFERVPDALRPRWPWQKPLEPSTASNQKGDAA